MFDCLIPLFTKGGGGNSFKYLNDRYSVVLHKKHKHKNKSSNMIKSFEDESGVSSVTPFQLAQGDEL